MQRWNVKTSVHRLWNPFRLNPWSSMTISIRDMIWYTDESISSKLSMTMIYSKRLEWWSQWIDGLQWWFWFHYTETMMIHYKGRTSCRQGMFELIQFHRRWMSSWGMIFRWIDMGNQSPFHINDSNPSITAVLLKFVFATEWRTCKVLDFCHEFLQTVRKYRKS